MLTDSYTEKIEANKSTLFDLFGAWKDSSDMDDIENVINESRTNTKTRNIVSFD